ncbi:MAG: family intrarane metalloprotease [Arthrobacter sp.]|nr:family intrarane metalloprotease [Arthrobacter sp.]
MPHFTVWLQHHHLSVFFVLAYAISWSSWPLYAVGLMPRMEFLPIGPLVAALLVSSLAWGRFGFKAWAQRLIRWRVGWAWYAVALLLPPLLVLVTAFTNIALDAPATGPADLAWFGLLTVFAFRMVNPMDGPLGEEPGFRGYAVPFLQKRRTPLHAAAVLGVLVSLWHLPLVVFGHLSLIGLPTTFAITFLYVWLFNRTGGSVLLTMLFHANQGTFTVGSFGFAEAAANRAELIYLAVVLVAALAAVLLDRNAWRPLSEPTVGVAPPRYGPDN